ncbi:hypothetical protein V1506DRAFT_545462 [Lipomyces tetrasporus]
MESAVRETAQQSYYGPLEYRGHKWVGKLREAFIEVWRPDSYDRFESIHPIDSVEINVLADSFCRA